MTTLSFNKPKGGISKHCKLFKGKRIMGDRENEWIESASLRREGLRVFLGDPRFNPGQNWLEIDPMTLMELTDKGFIKSNN